MDDGVESSGGRTVNISVTASGGGYNGITEEIEAKVTDNDEGTSGITIESVPSSVRRGCLLVTYEVFLKSMPKTSPVKVRVTSADPKIVKVSTATETEAAAASVSLTFTSMNYDGRLRQLPSSEWTMTWPLIEL